MRNSSWIYFGKIVAQKSSILYYFDSHTNMSAEEKEKNALCPYRELKAFSYIKVLWPQCWLDFF